MRDRILQLVQIKGPLLPVDIRSELKIDFMFVGAYLSELLKAGKIKTSHAKIGSSSLYYVEGQEKYLEQLRSHLHPKLQQTYDLLKERKILADKELTEVMKSAMREMKDFAVPLTVNKTELFWKFFTVSQDEAISLIKIKLSPKVEEKIEENKTEEKKEIIQQKIEVPIHSTEHKPKVKDVEIKKAVATVERRAQEIKDRDEKIVVQKIEPEINEEKEIEKMKKKEIEEKQKEDMKKKEIEKIDEEAETKPSKKTKIREKTIENIEDPLLDQVKEYFREKDIYIKEAEVTRKERELELVITVPSVIGRISYFCSVRNKKKCNEGDVSSAVIKAQSKNLPTLFLTTGEVTKKALEMVGKEFKQLIIKRID